MRRRAHALALALAGALTACAPPRSTPPPAALPQRIVSLAPSATEILFALGLGDRVVGVTKFCDYPAAARTRPKLGEFTGPYYEALLAAQPDLCLFVAMNREVAGRLAQLGLRAMETRTESIADIHEAVRQIGATCGVAPAAEALLAELNARTGRVAEAVAGRARPRVLVCIGRDTTARRLSGLYFAGPGTFYDEVIAAAGGLNACPGYPAAYPQLAAEGVVGLDPEVILDLGSLMESGAASAPRLVRQWDDLGVVSAVKRGRVHAILGSHALRPGPRYIELLEEVARRLHPKAFDGHRA